MTSSSAQRLVLAAILLFTVLLGARGITDEASVMMGADMARYVMNGVFVHDLIARGGVWNFDDLIRSAELYYARYPALSLGHHPPLPYFALAPFYAVFGISLFAARLAALSWFVLAAWGMYAVARRMFGWQVASWATLLFVTNLLVLRAGQYVLSEMPMVALVLLSVNALLRFCDTRRPAHLAWFVFAVVASLFAKQLAAFMFPVYAVILFARIGWRGLANRRSALIVGIGAALVVPLVVMTLALAPDNVNLVIWQLTTLANGTRRIPVTAIVQTIMFTQLSLPAMIAAGAGVAALIVRRDRRVIVVLAWVLSVVGGTVVFAGGVEPARYAFGAIPAYCLLAAGLATITHSRPARWAGVLALSCAVLWQSWLIRGVHPSGAGGYEAAAEYVVDHSAEPVVLFDSSVDTGYFVFFVRKHDPQGRLMVLRADKLMTTSPVDETGPGSRFTGPDEFYSVLRKFGIQFVVVEERSTGPRAIRMLHDELKADRFIERQRIPIVSSQPELRGVDLVIYEFKDAQPPDLDAVLDINLPLGRREVKLRLRDVVGTGGR